MKEKVQVWIIARHGGWRALLLRTTSARGEFWQPVTGGVEEGEDLESAARRELREETGFDPSSGTWLSTGYSFDYFSKWGPAHETVWVWVVSADEIPALPHPTLDSHEHQMSEWLTIEEAKQRLHFDSNRIALSHVLRVLPVRD